MFFYGLNFKMSDGFNPLNDSFIIYRIQENRMKLIRQFLIIVLLLIGILSVDLTPVALSDSENTRIYVSIKGAVEKEETISLKQYATVQEAIDQIQLKENADISSLNPNMVLKDADVLSIPYQTDEEELPRVSINQATREELQQLDGIGPSTADAIIQYREEHGLYQTIEDIMKVKGIGNAKFEKIKEKITL